jgi:hypothetical protein
VTLTTGDPRDETSSINQQGPGQPGLLKISFYFNGLMADRGNGRGAAAATFSARRQDLPYLAVPKPVRLIASREYGLY